MSRTPDQVWRDITAVHAQHTTAAADDTTQTATLTKTEADLWAELADALPARTPPYTVHAVQVVKLVTRDRAERLARQLS